MLHARIVEALEVLYTDRLAEQVEQLVGTAGGGAPRTQLVAPELRPADPGDTEGAQWAGMRIHRIASEMLTELGASSKVNAEWEFFSLLHDEGRRSAQVFLEAHALDLGRRSTLDIDVLLQNV